MAEEAGVFHEWGGQACLFLIDFNMPPFDQVNRLPWTQGFRSFGSRLP